MTAWADRSASYRERRRVYKVTANMPSDRVYRRNDREHKRKYGITLAERDQLFIAQGRCCACCEGLNPGRKVSPRSSRLAETASSIWILDHDHQTGAIRGIICHTCNVIVRLMGDTLDGAQAWSCGRVIQYLSKTAAQTKARLSLICGVMRE